MSWFNSLQKSYEANRMLDHTSVLSVATLVNSMPAISPLRFQRFHNQGMIFYLDRRSALFLGLLSGPSEFLWHFPLTSEFYKFSGGVTEEINGEFLQNIWSSLEKREKDGYLGLPSDVIVVSEKHEDVNSFKPQEAMLRSENFVVIVVKPEVVEHSRFIDKTAIGNSRKVYESLPQPDAVSKRWVHRVVEGEWKCFEVNVSVARM